MSLNDQFFAQYPNGRRPPRRVFGILALALAVAGIATWVVLRPGTPAHQTVRTAPVSDVPPPYSQAMIDKARLTVADLPRGFRLDLPDASVDPSPEGEMSGCPEAEAAGVRASATPGKIQAEAQFAAGDRSTISVQVGAAPSIAPLWAAYVMPASCPRDLTLDYENGASLDVHVTQVPAPRGMLVYRFTAPRAPRAFTAYVAAAKVNRKATVSVDYFTPRPATATVVIQLLKKARTKAQRVLGAE